VETSPENCPTPEFRLFRFLLGLNLLMGLVVSGVGLLIVKEIHFSADLRESGFQAIQQQVIELRAEHAEKIAEDKSSRFKEAMAWVAWRSELARQLELKFDEPKQESKP
jgi:hypothetical protein